MINGRPLYQSEKIPINPTLVTKVECYLETHDLGNRGIEDGDKRKQLVGLLGELTVIEKLTGIAVDLEQRLGGFDGGFDLIYKGNRIDVKTMERKSFVRGEYVNNFYIMQENYKSEIIVFCSYHAGENVVEICGWIYKSELPDVGKLFKKGTRRLRADGTSFEFRQDNYEVMNKDLRPLKQLLEL